MNASRHLDFPSRPFPIRQIYLLIVQPLITTIIVALSATILRRYENPPVCGRSPRLTTALATTDQRNRRRLTGALLLTKLSRHNDPAQIIGVYIFDASEGI